MNESSHNQQILSGDISPSINESIIELFAKMLRAKIKPDSTNEYAQDSLNLEQISILLLKSCTENSLELYNSCKHFFSDFNPAESDIAYIRQENLYIQNYSTTLVELFSRYRSELHNLKMQKCQLDTANLEISDLAQIRNNDQNRNQFLQKISKSDKNYQPINSDLTYQIDRLNNKVSYMNTQPKGKT